MLRPFHVTARLLGCRRGRLPDPAPVAPVAYALGSACQTGAWNAPGSERTIDHSSIIAGGATAPVVLLGEIHDNPEHHRWQSGVTAGLLGQRRNLVLGFEAFPRHVQPVLDRWVSGELTEAAFLREVDWWRNWGFDPDP